MLRFNYIGILDTKTLNQRITLFTLLAYFIKSIQGLS